ncbi:low temperature requirement protein A [Rhodococcus maanshanensis]|uniref:Low temperature requirement protein LtrA n=1 Tax=Rhodococcus maanshanensis TaxID=183556 RepID=A0A1H7SDY5_9NOCA|nr:low temperature requirement protein A [Rhodococcus maanshanensis]SEL70683.1 Low temperature requirement protein LtrA [Rhodococcus maanshanensis]
MDQPALDGADSVADAPIEPPPEQRVAWAELFFDLIWVFAVTQIATALAGAHDIGEAARLLLLFMPLWWGWVGTTLLANRAGALVDQALGRVALFSVAGCGLLMSVAVGGAFDDRALVFAAGYVVLRLLLWVISCRLPGGSARLRLEPFAVAAFVAAPLFLLGAFLEGPGRIAAWTAAALIELIAPRVLPASLNHVRIETAHLPERFGLFLIIALGETVVAVGGQAAGIDLDGPTYAAFALAFLIIVLLWWTYFHYGAPAARHSLEHSPEQARIVTDVFSYAHLIYVTAIIAIAVGLKKLLAYPLSVPHSLPELLLAPGVALYLFGFCYARWRMFGAATVQRAAAAAACCAIAVAAPLLPALATAMLVLAVLLALNGYEAWIVTTHRPLPLLRLPRIVRRETQR